MFTSQAFEYVMHKVVDHAVVISETPHRVCRYGYKAKHSTPKEQTASQTNLLKLTAVVKVVGSAHIGNNFGEIDN